jgi:hypothetical protein
MRRSAVRRLIQTSLLSLLLLPLLGPAEVGPSRWQAGSLSAEPGYAHGAHRHGEVHSQGRAPAPTDDQAVPGHVHVGAQSRSALSQLLLTWGAETAHVGVPVPLSIEVLGADGRREAQRTGVISLLVDDDRAQVSLAGADQPLGGVPTTGGRRVAIPFGGGRAEVRVRFAGGGEHKLLAQLADTIEIAGESERLVVQPTFLSLRREGGGSTLQGSSGRYVVAAQDEQGLPVSGYDGVVVVSTSDAGALVQAVTATAGAAATGPAQPEDRGGAVARIRPTDRG